MVFLGQIYNITMNKQLPAPNLLQRVPSVLCGGGGGGEQQPVYSCMVNVYHGSITVD